MAAKRRPTASPRRAPAKPATFDPEAFAARFPSEEGQPAPAAAEAPAKPAPKKRKAKRKAKAGAKMGRPRTYKAALERQSITMTGEQKSALYAHLEGVNARREAEGLASLSFAAWAREVLLHHAGLERLTEAGAAAAKAAALEGAPL